MINLLLKKPHSSEYVHDCIMDADVFQQLQQDGWGFSINSPASNRVYVKIYRQRNGIRQQHWLHRYLAFWDFRAGFQVHHQNGNSLDNSLDNLLPLPVREHRRLHPRSRRVAQ